MLGGGSVQDVGLCCKLDLFGDFVGVGWMDGWMVGLIAELVT